MKLLIQAIFALAIISSTAAVVPELYPTPICGLECKVNTQPLKYQRIFRQLDIQRREILWKLSNV